MTALPSRYEQYQSFFSHVAKALPKKSKVSEAIKKADSYTKSHYRDEVYAAIVHIEHEAEAYFQIFKDNQSNKEKLASSGVIELCAFTSQVLLYHYQSYDKKAKIECYEDRLKLLKDFVDDTAKTDKVAPKSKPSQDRSELRQRFEWICQNTKDKASAFWSILTHPSQFRDQLAFANIPRVYWVFCHFSLNAIKDIVKDSDILKQISNILGTPIDLDAFSDALNMPNDVLNILSVAFFYGRLVVDVLMIVKHAYGSNDQERANTTPKQRLMSELDKRFWSLTNCAVWGTVNLLTNYYEAFGIPENLAFPIVAGVLVFDVALVFALRHREKAQYTKTLETIEAKLAELSPHDSMYEVLSKQLEAVKENWQIKEQVYNYNAVAAVLLVSCFTLSITLSAPAAILACYLVCCVGVAIYGTNDEYEAYVRVSKRLEHAQTDLTGKFNAAELQQLAEEKATAEYTYQAALLEKAFAPLALFILAGISAPVGLTAAAGYLAYKMNRSYCEQSSDKSQSKEVEVKPQAFDDVDPRSMPAYA